MDYNGLGEYVYSFGDCIPFKIDGAAAESAQVNKYAKCYGYSYVVRFPLLVTTSTTPP